MRTKPYLYSALAGTVGLGFMALNFEPIPPTIKLDDRLNIEMVGNITGLSFSNQPTIVPASFDLDLKLPIQPPALYFGFDPPSADMTARSIRKNNFRIVTAFHSLYPQIHSFDDLTGSYRDSKIYTDDHLVYARFHKDLPNMEFKKDTKAILKEITTNDKGFAIINSEKVTPKVRAASGSLPISVWMGWRKSSFPLADRLGINGELETTIEKLLKGVQSQDESPPITLIAVGDIMLARSIGKKMTKEIKNNGETGYPFGGIVETLKNADITIGNLECAISAKGTPLPGKDYTFRAHPNSTRQLTTAGFDIVTLANNHSKDYGAEALIDTLEHLKKAGIVTVGAGKNRTEAREFKVMTTKDGTRIGFLGYTMVLPRDFLADSKTAGVAWSKEKGLAKDIKAAKASCDILMVQYHWGTEYTVNPNEAQRSLAHKTIDIGADIVIGHHPHWIQEVEFYKDKFIAYSLGNFVFDMNHRPKVTEGMIVTCEIRNKKITQVHCDPISLKGGQPEIITWEATNIKRDRKTIMKEIFVASGLIKPDPAPLPKSPTIKLAKAK